MKSTSLVLALCLALGGALSLHCQLKQSVGFAWLAQPLGFLERDTVLLLEPMGPAMAARVKVGDRILAINGFPPERVKPRDLHSTASRTYLFYRADAGEIGRAALLTVTLVPGSYSVAARATAWLEWILGMLVLASGLIVTWNFLHVPAARLFWVLYLQWAVFIFAGVVFTHFNEALFTGSILWWQSMWLLLAALLGALVGSVLVHLSWTLSTPGQRWLVARWLIPLYLLPILLALLSGGLFSASLALKGVGAVGVLASVGMHLLCLVVSGYFFLRGFREPPWPAVTPLLSAVTRGLIWVIAGKFLEILLDNGIPMLTGKLSWQWMEWGFFLGHLLALSIMAAGTVKIARAFGVFARSSYKLVA